MLDGSWTDGFLILHRGRVVVEDYRNGMRPGSVHLTQSVSKSVVAALAGILHHRGSLPLDRTVAAYVPEFSATAAVDEVARRCCAAKRAGLQPALTVPVTTDARANAHVRPHSLATYDRLHGAEGDSDDDG